MQYPKLFFMNPILFIVIKLIYSYKYIKYTVIPEWFVIGTVGIPIMSEEYNWQISTLSKVDISYIQYLSS